MKKTLLLSLPFAAILGLAGWPGAGLSQALPDKATPFEPRAYRLFTDALTFLQSAQKFTFRAEAWQDLPQEGGASVEFGTSSRVAVNRPSGLWMDSRSDSGRRRVWFDGSRFTLLDVDHSSYFTTSLPATNNEALEALARNFKVRFPLDGLLRTDALARMQKMVLGGFCAGLSVVDGVECHHLVLVGEEIDAQIWIEDAPAPLIRKLVLIHKKRPGSPKQTLFLSDWDFSPALPDTAFGALMPKGAILCPIETLKPKGPAGTN